MKTNYRTNTSFELKVALSFSVAISALFVGLGSAAHAQEEGADETSRLPTVTVSGTKREQTLQDTPVAISVVQAEEIQRAEIQDLNDLQTLVPSLTVRQTQSSSNTSFFIRGFGNGANAIGLEPSVGIFIDGVFRSRAAAYIPDLPNLERVEVLRGPQSTLFGKNASAGVVSVVTRGPQFETEGNIEASIGNYNAFRAKGDITGPISETLAYSLAGSFNQRDGYAEDLGNGEEYNDRDRWGIRGELLFVPTENLEFRFIADYDEIDEQCCLLTNIVEDPASGAAVRAAGGQVVSQDPFSYEVFYDDIPTNEIENSGFSLQADWDLGFATLTSITADRSSEESSVLDADATDLAFLTSNTNTDISTFTQEFRLTSNSSDSRIDWMIGGFYFDETIEQDSSVVFGEDYRNFLSALLGGAGGIPAGQAQIAGLETFAGVPPGMTFAQSGQGNFEDLQQDNQSWSLFGTMDFHITDRLTATLGLNYTEDEKEVEMDIVSTDALAAVNIDQLGYTATLQGILAQQGVSLTNPASIGPFIQMNPQQYAAIQQQALAVAQSDANPFGGLRALQVFPPFLSFPNAVEDGQSNDSDTTYTLRLSYDVSDNINVYGTYATGFKATSWNLQRQSKPFSSDLTAGNPIFDPVTMQPVFLTPSSPVTDAGLFTNNLEPGTRFADPEEAEVFEIGLKAQFDTIAFNVAIFDQTIENFQTTVFTEDGFVFQNADEQSSIGLELDTTWSPIPPLTLTFAGTFLDAEYDSYPNFAPGIDLSGETPQGIADTQFTVGGNYNFRIGDMGAYVRGDWQHVADSDLFDNPNDQAAVDAVGYSREQNIVNASAGIMTPNGIAVSVWARNLFDDEYLIGAAAAVAQAGTYNGLPNQPRTYGLTVRKSF